MMLSEEEAKTKWCPHVRVTAGTDAVGHSEWHTNRPSHAEVHEKNFDRCIGSACMAWRWEPEEDFDERYSQWDDRFTVAVPDGTTYEPEPQQKGYCGLAGPSS